MKTAKMSTILVLRSELLRRVALVLALGLMVPAASVARGDVSLTVNNQPLDSITLKVGQTCTVEVVSDDSNPYNAYVGFDNGLVLGTFSHLETRKKEAGDLADATEYDVATFYGYFIVSAGSLPPPSPGVHFVFQYTAQQLGETDLKLYDEILTSVRDSVHITVVPAEMGTAFTYQGRLLDANDVANGLYDFEFELYDAPSDGNQLGSMIDINDLDVIDGYFTVELDYGSDVFDGSAVWLETTVAHADGSDPCTLRPRQEVTPVPYALQTRGIFVSDAGNVGIGTTSPGAKLDVSGSVRIGGNYIYLNDDGPDGNQYIYFYEGGSPTGASLRWDNNQTRFRFNKTVAFDAYAVCNSSLYSYGPITYLGTSDAHRILARGKFTGFRIHVGAGGTENYANAEGDLYVQDALEVDGNVYLGNSTGDITIISGKVGIGTTSPEDIFTIAKTLQGIGGPETETLTLIPGSSERGNPASFVTSFAHVRFITPSNIPINGSGCSDVSIHAENANFLGKLVVGSSGSISGPDGSAYFNGNVSILGSVTLATQSGNVGIGTTSPQGKLDVNGSIYQRGSVLHADYVFEPGYELESIDKHSEYMWQNKHLAAIPKTKVDENGQEIIEVGAHRRGIVEELEKAHIYIEQLHKRVKTLEEKLMKLEAGLNAVQ